MSEQSAPRRLGREEESRTREALLFMLEDLEDNRREIERAKREWINVVDTIDDLLFIHDRHFRIVRANRAYAARANLPFAALIGRVYWEVFPKRTGPLPGCLRVTGGAVHDQEEEIALPTGEVFVSRSLAVSTAPGEQALFLHIMQDVTERRLAAARELRAERRFRALIENASDLVATLDEKGVVTYISPSVRRIGGYAPEELVGRNYLDFAHPDDREAGLAGFATILADPSRANATELRFRHKDGHWVTMDSVSRNACGDPEIGGIIINSRDTTERKRAEVEIKALAKFPAENPNAVLRVSADGILIYANPASVLVLRACGCRVGQRVPGDWERTVRRALAESALQRDEIETEGRSIAMTFSPVGEQGYVNVYGVDITERKCAEHALRRANRALRTLSAGNEALVRAADEQALLVEMCRVIVEVGGYRVAVVGYARNDERMSVLPKACAGVEFERLSDATVSWGDNEFGQGVIGTAIRTGKAQVLHDALDHPAYARWQKLIVETGVRAVLTLPLWIEGERTPLGALFIAAGEADAFNEREVELLAELARDLAFGVATLRTRAERRLATEKLHRGLESTIEAIAATVETRDPYTAGHQRRVAQLAAAIGREMGLPEETLRGIHFGALIHDVGKVQVPAEILAKPRRLTPIEYELIKGHPEAGYQILKGIEFPWPVAAMVHQHHERLDGSGYPLGLKGDAITLEARVLAVADVVEAMSSHRPYRPGLGIEAALKEIEAKRGVVFDAAAVDACLRLFRDKGYKLPA